MSVRAALPRYFTDSNSIVTGSWHRHKTAVLPDDPADGPVLLCSSPRAARTECAATEIKDIVLELSGL